MVIKKDSVKEIIKKYIRELERNHIHIEKAFIFGSYANGSPGEESDIDVAIVSPVFTGIRFEDRRKIVPIRRKIDSRIEPIPFTPEDFETGGILIDEIKKSGKRIL